MTFGGKTLKFPQDETRILPVVNVTVEELAHYLLAELLRDSAGEGLVEVELGVSSGPTDRSRHLALGRLIFFLSFELFPTRGCPTCNCSDGANSVGGKETSCQ